MLENYIYFSEWKDSFNTHMSSTKNIDFMSQPGGRSPPCCNIHPHFYADDSESHVPSEGNEIGPSYMLLCC